MRHRPLRIFHAVLLSSLGAVGGAIAQAPPASPASQATQTLHYAFDADLHGSVSLAWQAQGWILEVRQATFVPGAEVRLWRNETLLPPSHPLDDQPARLRALQLEPTGFTVVVEYPVSTAVESHQLTFEHLKALDTASCPAKLIRYRFEQRRPDGGLRSGLVADFPLGIARLLAIEGQPADTPLLPARLLPRDTCMTALPSVFEGIALLDVPKVR